MRSARPAGTEIALRSRVCVCVCVCPQLSRALSYVIHYYATSTVEATGSLQAEARLVCCLDGERVVGNDDNSVLARSDC